jgi:hypothetical protein
VEQKMGQSSTELVEVLLEAGVLKQDEVVQASVSQGSGSLVEKALTMGSGNENDVLKILSNRMNLATIGGDELFGVSQEILQLLPKNVIMRYHVFPFFADDSVLNIAMIDPTDDSCLNEIAFFTELKIFPYGVLASKLTRALNKFFGMGLPEAFMHKSVGRSGAAMGATTMVGPMPSSLPGAKPGLPPKPGSANPAGATPSGLPPRPSRPSIPGKPAMPGLPPKGGVSLPPKPGMQQKPEAQQHSVSLSQGGEKEIFLGQGEEKTKIIVSLEPEKKGEGCVNDDKSVIVEALNKQKEVLEQEFNNRLEDMKKRFSKLEEDKKLDKLKEELEERLEMKRTMDKLSEMERNRYVGGQPYAPPYYNLPPGYGPYPPQGYFPGPYGQQQQQQQPEKTESGVNEDVTSNLSKQIEELKKQMMELSKGSTEKGAEQKVEETLSPSPPEFELPPPTAVTEPAVDMPGIADIDAIVRDMKRDSAMGAAGESMDEMIIDGLANVDVTDILHGSDKSRVLDAVIKEMKKISRRSIVLFVKYENLVGVAGFGEHVQEDKVQGYSTTFILPGIFKKVYDTKKPIHGKAEFTELTKKFLDYFGGMHPESMTLVPCILKNKVFAMIYAEEVGSLDNVVKVADAMSQAFAGLLSQR